ARPKVEVGVGKFRLHLHGAGSLVDLVVHDLQNAAIDHGLVIAAERLDDQRTARERALDAAQLLLRQAEEHRDRLDLRDDDDGAAAAVATAHDVAFVDLPDPGAPGDRGHDL